MIRITTRRDVAPHIDGYMEYPEFAELCDAVWDALGKTLGEAILIAPSGSVSHYLVDADELSEFCSEYVGA